MKSLLGLVVAAACLLGACTSVPQEVVTLSSLTSNDTRALHGGYRSLVRKHFEALRKIREQEFASQVLGPYIEGAIQDGHLIEVVQGKLVWNSEKEAFVPPDPTKASLQKLDTLHSWNRQVTTDIEELRKDAFGDLAKQESDVLDAVDLAFGNVIRGDAAIHGYLLSIQKVNTAQNEFFKGIGLEEFPKKISDSLDKASTDAAGYTAKLKALENKAKDLKTRVKKAAGG